VRLRLRATDRLYRIGTSELLVLMPVTHSDAARVVCSDIPLALSPTAGSERVDVNVIEANGLRAEVLLDRLRSPLSGPDEYELPLDSLTRTP
jgi:GGDEF domain-containing protein